MKRVIKKSYKYLMLVTLLGAITSCEEDFDNEVSKDLTSQSAGSADFTRYVSLGNSLTSGYANGTVYISGQKHSYPVMLAERFKQTTPSMEEFTVPYVKDEIGGLLAGGKEIGKTKLVLNASLKPESIGGVPTTDIMNGIGAEGPYGNMGVPGAKSYHLLANGYGSVAGVEQGLANPYYAYFATSETTNVFTDALSQNPTFFTLWIGNNDVLGYSSAGGDEAGVDQTGNTDLTKYGINDISDPAIVISSIQTMVDGLVKAGAEGVVANIPNVTSIPYFTTVPYNALPLDQATVDVVNMAFEQYNGGLQLAMTNGMITQEEVTTRTVHYVAGQNSILIEDDTLTDLTALGLPSYRLTTVSDLILLTASGFLGALKDPNDPTSVYGVTVPLPGNLVLTESEVLKVQKATDAYNVGISEIVANYPGVYMVDMKAGMEELSSTGFLYDGIQYSDAYITGASFSLDGVHPTPKGYAIIANYFIKTINDSFGATLLELNPNIYPGL